ncbi:MAG: DegT/DnrJ/EryC1/StrS family aminotransferase [Acetobacteraceae bacterium]|nr:DegT/DnrJ/EryC1/StrS family aminotransferase [Acetobacteraceae bacterium]
MSVQPDAVAGDGEASADEDADVAEIRVSSEEIGQDVWAFDLPPSSPSPETGWSARGPQQTASKQRIPFVRPNPPRLSRLIDELAIIDKSGIYSNYGPVNTRLEQAFTEVVFGGTGGCLTVCNATLGLMICIKHAIRAQPRRRFALMPSFTFAATAHAALWAGLTPLLCDIDPDTWLPSPAAEEALLKQYGQEIAVVVPCATFGNCLDLDYYDHLSSRYGVPLVVDAAASLGCETKDGVGFGAGFPHPVVYSMHATKAFATSEGGVIHCADPETLRTLRAMGNFGFGQPRRATLPGLNSKMSEVAALIALNKLSDFVQGVAHRNEMAEVYRAELPGWRFQKVHGNRHAFQFMSMLLPPELSLTRDEILAGLAERGIGAGSYFSPHLAEQPYFRETCEAADLANTDAVSGRILSLPMSDFITTSEVRAVCAALRDLEHFRFTLKRRHSRN